MNVKIMELSCNKKKKVKVIFVTNDTVCNTIIPVYFFEVASFHVIFSLHISYMLKALHI